MLDGLDIIYAYSWPNAIFQGNGTAQLYITKRANKEQRGALMKIFSGKAGGDGYFAFLPKIISSFLEPQFVDIVVHLDGRKSSFCVKGILEVKSESFRDPITGDEQQITVSNPKGKIWKAADFASSKVLRISTPRLNFNYSNKHSEYAVVEFGGPDILKKKRGN